MCISGSDIAGLPTRADRAVADTVATTKHTESTDFDPDVAIIGGTLLRTLSEPGIDVPSIGRAVLKWLKNHKVGRSGRVVLLVSQLDSVSVTAVVNGAGSTRDQPR